MTRTLYIIDGHSQIHRAYHAPFRDLTSPTGEPTRATYVFCTMLLKFIADRKPDYLAMAIDGPREKLERRKVYPEYKATRTEAPEDFHPQVTRIMQIVEAMGIPILASEGHEADDILATAAGAFACDDLRVILVSRDKDLDQLVSDNVLLYDPMKDETLGPAQIEAAKGYTPAQAIDVQALMGDTSDNIPGIPGVGAKTAVKLIARYGSAQAVLDHADEQTPKLRERLLAGREAVDLSRQLVTLRCDVPIELDLAAMEYSGIDGAAVRPIFAELGFNRLMDQLDDAGVGAAGATMDIAATAAANRQTTAEDFDYVCADTAEALDSLVSDLAGVTRLAVDTETTSVLPMWADLVGISLAWQAGHAVYIPVRGPLGAATLDVELVAEKLGGVLADENIEKIGQNIKYDIIVLARAGMEVAGELFDTMIAAHVLDSSRMTYKLDALVAEMLNHRCIPIEEVIGRGRHQTTMDAVPVETVAPYAAEDADVTLRLADVLASRLADEGLADLMTRLEMPLLPVLVAMERRGVTVDPAALNRMASTLSSRADALRDRILELAGRPFNVDSPKQLAEVLFTDLDLPVLKKKKTGPSTDSSVLSELAIAHELPGLVLDYRKLMKLLGTYLKALGQRIHPRTGRVHTSFHQAGTATGRLSSSDPNLQNIPIRTDEGRQVRSAFVASEGNVLMSADYSQVELRVLAHLCQDPTMMAAFHAGQDIHRTVAAEVFGVPVDEVTVEQRSRAKGVNFGIVYGQTAFGLSVALRIPRGEAAEFIKRYKQRFGLIEEYLQECVAFAKSNGYVETIFGRRRPIAEISARNPQRRAQAERLAINTVVQGSAADLIKQAMINIDARIRREGRPSQMLLQIHDELVFETPRDCVDDERETIVAEMTGAIDLRVPLKVDVGVGDNWMDAK